MIEAPQSFVVREECEKAAWKNGLRREFGATDCWAAFGSTTAPCRIYLATSSALAPWFLALDNADVDRSWA